MHPLNKFERFVEAIVVAAAFYIIIRAIVGF